MKNNNKNKNPDEEQKVAEPLAIYQTKKTIKIFNSFEEAKQDEIDFIISQSPVERVQHTVGLILRAFDVTAESLSARKRNHTITIIKSE